MPVDENLDRSVSPRRAALLLATRASP